MRQTQIVATIGPASENRLPALIRAGVNVVRLNFSHGDYAEHRQIIRDVRRIGKQTGKKVLILQDLQGPKLRVCEIAPGTRYRTGDVVTVTNCDVVGDAKTIPVSYKQLPGDVKPGDRLLLKDGEIELKVLKTSKTEVTAKVLHGGALVSHQGLAVPGVTLSIPALTAKDRKDLAFGLAHRVDYVALSFVTSAGDMERVRRSIAKQVPASQRPKLIAKIEKHEAVADLESIIKAADGVMVARGDLALDVPPAEVPFIQKEIIRRANWAGKPVITATQMLESMVEHPRPTRAEVSDVANAVLDGTDAVMLSEETAVGDFPVEAVKTMRLVVEDAEWHLKQRHRAGLLL